MTETNFLVEAFSTDAEPIPLEATFAERMGVFAGLQLRRRDLEMELDTVKRQAAELESGLLEEMAQSGMDNVRCQGLTIYRKRDLYVSKREGVETTEVIEVLKDCGLGYLVEPAYSAAALKSKVREWRDDGETVPEKLAGLMSIGERVGLGSRK